MNYYTAPVELLRSIFAYDGETGIFRRHTRSRQLGYLEPEGYMLIWFRGKAIRANRLAWALTHGVWPEVTVDHVNRDRADNRIANLRLATHAQNFSNTGLRASTKTGFKGVRPYSTGEGFGATITVRGTRHWLGSFAKAEDAALAYDRAALYLFDKFATTNYSLGLL